MSPKLPPGRTNRKPQAKPAMDPEMRLLVLEQLGQAIASKRKEAIDARLNSGVYAITNLRNGKRYVGSAVDLKARFSYHRWELKRGQHHSVKLQRAWQKYGEAAFQFDVLLICSPENRLMYEQIAIDGFATVKAGYNVLPMAGNNSGFRHTAETRAHLAAVHTGKKMSPEMRAKRRAQMLGRPQTEEAKAKISAKLKGRPLPEHVKQGLRERTVSPEQRARIAEGMRAVWAARRAA